MLNVNAPVAPLVLHGVVAGGDHLLLDSFTLYPAHWRIGRGNLVLRQSVPHYPPCILSDGTQRRICLDQSEEIKILNISFYRLRIEPTNFHVHTSQLHIHAPAPRLVNKLNWSLMINSYIYSLWKLMYYKYLWKKLLRNIK